MVRSGLRQTGGRSARLLLPLLTAALIGIGIWGIANVLICTCVAAAEGDSPAEGGGDAAGVSERSRYEELPVNDELRRQYYQRVTAILNTGRFGPGDRTIFDEYHRDYALARWGTTKERELRAIHTYRNELKASLRKAKNGEVHDHLNELVLDFMKNLVTGRYDVRVQVNAALMIGELNATEQMTGGRYKPLRDALPVLIGFLSNDETSDAVRAAVMTGIIRHAAAGITEDNRRELLTSVMLREATAEIPSGPAGSGRDWIRGQAIETLGYLGSVGENNDVCKAIAGALADSDVSFFTRCIAAQSLGRLKFANVEGINATEVAEKLGRLIVDACNGGHQAGAEGEAPTLQRRRIVQCLDAVLIAIAGEDDATKGIGALVGDAQDASLDELREIVEEKIKPLEDPKLDESLLGAQIADLRDKVEGWLTRQSK